MCFFTVQRPVDIKNRPRIPIPDEDPYSIAVSSGGSGSSGSSGFGTSAASSGHVAATREQLLLQTQQYQQRRSRDEKPPKLPPRDNVYPQDMPKGFKVSFNFRRVFNLFYVDFFLCSLIMMN